MARTGSAATDVTAMVLAAGLLLCPGCAVQQPTDAVPEGETTGGTVESAFLEAESYSPDGEEDDAARAGSAFFHGAVACGTTITRSTKLSADLVGCPSVGIELGADDITLDCDGHTISGAAGTRGIFADLRANVTVRDCVVTGFRENVYLSRSIGSTVKDSRFPCDVFPAMVQVGVFLQQGVNERVTRNEATGCWSNFVAEATRLATFSHNVARAGSAGFTLKGGAIGGSVRENQVFGSREGLVLAGVVRGCRVERNEVHDSEFGLLVVQNSFGNRIAHNRILAPTRTSVVVESRRNHFDENVFLDGSESGLAFGNDANDNLLTENAFYDHADLGVSFAALANGNVLDDDEGCGNGTFDAFQAPGAGNRLLDNEFCSTSGF